MAGTLNIVATPIGNLEDITLRALKVLKKVDVIAAEDTRHTRKLLAHYGIEAKVVSYYEQNERARSVELIKRLKDGEDVALVSDAGTPGISDPGYRLIRAAAGESIPVVSVPGPSALAAAISISALPIDTFSFKGFMPSTSGKRRKFLLALKGLEETIVLYESPKRLVAALGDISEVLGGDVETVVAREMTKMHEEVLRGSASELFKRLGKKASLKGEITLLVRLAKHEASEEDVDRELKALIESGISTSEVSKRAAASLGLPKGALYKKALKIKSAQKEAKANKER